MKSLTRRVFMKMIGMLSVLGISPGILNGLDCHATEFDDRDEIDPRTPSCFVGVGAFGRKIMEALKNSSDFIPSKSQRQFQDHGEIVLLAPTEIDSHHYNEPLIFLTGSISDPYFWTVRDFILSKNPKLIVTIALTEADIGIRGLGPRPKNEFWIALSMNETLNTAVNIVSDVYHSINLPGLVNFNLADYYDLSNNIGLGISLESSVQNNVPELKRFVKQHSNVLKQCKKFLILILSFDYTADFEIDYFTELTKLTEIVHEAVDSETGINWCALNDRKMNPKFRATIIGV